MSSEIVQIGPIQNIGQESIKFVPKIETALRTKAVSGQRILSESKIQFAGDPLPIEPDDGEEIPQEYDNLEDAEDDVVNTPPQIDKVRLN